MKLLTYFFLVLAVFSFSIFGYLLFRHYNPSQLQFASLPEQIRTNNQQATPLFLHIPSLQLTVPIVPAHVDGKVWETTTKGVSYVITTPVPGENGNSILYGHNFRNILGKLPEIKPDAQIIVEFSDKSKKIFTVDKTATVSPDNSEVLAPSDTPVLTLYTCTGFLDSKRFVVRAI